MLEREGNLMCAHQRYMKTGKEREIRLAVYVCMYAHAHVCGNVVAGGKGTLEIKLAVLCCSGDSKWPGHSVREMTLSLGEKIKERDLKLMLL